MSVNLTLETLASKQRNDSTVAGVTVKDALETLEASNIVSVIPLAVTITDCENTASEINIVTAVVPANTLALGDIIEMRVRLTRRQNSGATINLTQRIKKNSVTMFNNTTGIGSNASDFFLMQNATFIVTDISGTNVTIAGSNSASSSITVLGTSINIMAGSSANGYTSTNGINNTWDRTTDASISLSAQFASAHANAYVRVQQAQAYIIKKAV